MRMTAGRLAIVGSWLLGCFSLAQAADPFQGASPVWSLIHEPAVLADLDPSRDQLRTLRNLLDAVDVRFFPLRNQPTEQANQAAEEILNGLTARLETLLTKQQFQRLLQIQLYGLGASALTRPELDGLMKYTPEQRTLLEETIQAGQQKTIDLHQRLAQGEPREALEAEYTQAKQAEQQTIQAALTPRQIAVWRAALGAKFDLGALGRPSYKAPEFIDTGDWINSEPLSLKALSGKVVVVHFYACGCINCVHNYPVYQDWERRFHGKDVVIVGIHTPETAFEATSANVRQKAEEAGLGFPVLIDTDKANWDAWGNSMWPSVYLVDKWGRLRSFWPGELKWQGATGDEWMAERIEELLAERTNPTPGG
jgi:thiol-disulfide isomerase/thioredoxin